MRFFVVIVFLSIIVTPYVMAQEYLYPIASFDKNGQILTYLFYQKSLKHIELWLWNSKTLEAQKALLSSYTPAGLRIIPDHSGFSFIDNGRIRIKDFAKRSPKSIDIYEPIYDIGVLEWIDGHCGYFSAQYQDRWMIFLFNRDSEEITCLAQSNHADYVYPTIKNNTLFFIERCNQKKDLTGNVRNSYRIMSAPLNLPETIQRQISFNSLENFDERVALIIEKQHQQVLTESIVADAQKTVLFDFGDQAIAFLTMENESVGYVLTHDSILDKSATALSLHYYHLEKIDNRWQKKDLFAFRVPLSLLLPDSAGRLYESLLPLLPKRFKDRIYFVDLHDARLSLYSYNYHSGTTQLEQANLHIEEYIFVPQQIGEALYSGGTIKNDGPPHLYFGNTGEMCCQLIAIQA